jgi:hypothetical protein
MVDKSLPKAVTVLPPKQTEFADANEKGKYVNLVLQASSSAMTIADERWT